MPLIRYYATFKLRYESIWHFSFLDFVANFYIDFKDKYSKTPLHYAASRGGRVAVQVMVDASVDVKDKFHLTPLHYAADQCDRAAIRGLIDAKATLDVCDALKRTPLHSTAERGHTGIIHVLLEHFLSHKIIHCCVIQGHRQRDRQDAQRYSALRMYKPRNLSERDFDEAMGHKEA